MSIPLLVGGGIVGFIASYPLEEELGDKAKLAVPATAVFFLAAAKLGILGTAALGVVVATWQRGTGTGMGASVRRHSTSGSGAGQLQGVTRAAA